MERWNVLILGALALAAVVSLVGVALYEDERAGELTVLWETESHAITIASTQHTGAGEVPISVPVDVANLTRLDILVHVTGAGPRLQPTQVHVLLESPDGETFEAEGEVPAGAEATVELPLTAHVQATPDVAHVKAASRDEAERRLAQEHTSDAGRGAWRLVVTFAASGPAPVTESHQVAVDATAHTYLAFVTPATPEVRR